LFGRWNLVTARWNFALLAGFLRPHAAAVPDENGVCTFYIARRK
jgi:hypothetical protein